VAETENECSDAEIKERTQTIKSAGWPWTEPSPKYAEPGLKGEGKKKEEKEETAACYIRPWDRRGVA
jgi:hypothetical protein